MTTLDVAVLGASERAQDHMVTISRLPSLCRLVGICGSDAERAAETGAKFGVPGFTDLDRMLAETDPQLLYVMTPPDAHHAAVELAGRRGIHVISETPIATTMPMASAMIDSAKRHGIKLEIAENVWRWPNERLKRQIIGAGLIGAVTQVHLWYYSGSYHGISAARTLIGQEPVRVRGYARDTPVPPHRDSIDRFLTSGPYEHGLIEFAGGAICVYQYPLYPHYRNYWDVVGTKGAIIGTDLIIMRDGERQVFPIREEIENSSEVPSLVRVYVETDPPVEWENPYRAQPVGAGADDIARTDILARMLRSIREDADPHYGAVLARNDQEVLTALRESARRDGAWVNLPLTELTAGEGQLQEDYAQRHGHDPLGDIEAGSVALVA